MPVKVDHDPDDFRLGWGCGSCHVATTRSTSGHDASLTVLAGYETDR
jgi:hypothetical protein